MLTRGRREPIRSRALISNHSSGKQGHAIAAALAALGAEKNGVVSGEPQERAGGVKLYSRTAAESSPHREAAPVDRRGDGGGGPQMARGSTSEKTS